MEIRVRFAPAPTGHLHIGGLRTAIFNWLFARHNNGKFLLRIEDTDIERSKQEYTDSILETFSWMSMNPDEPILTQTTRIDDHKKLVNKLLNEDKAYKCFCSKKSNDQEDSYSKYDGTCRTKKNTQENLTKPFVVRFKIPQDKEFISFNDLIHGNITFPIDQFDDFIILRSDSTPTYNFVVVCDDIFMSISHIIRGEDHISNTPKQILLYHALNSSAPQFAHVPSILNESGQKLSKRDAATSVIEYKKQGFLPDALFNYLVRLSWAHGDQEIFTKEELIKFFTLENVGKSGAVFDIKKLEWLNGVYIRQKNSEELLKIIENDIDTEFKSKFTNFNETQILQLIDLYKERVKTLKELSLIIIVLDKMPSQYEEHGLKEFITSNSFKYLEKLIVELTNLDDWKDENISSSVKKIVKELNIKLPELSQPIRIALTGSVSSPGVFALLAVLSKKESIERLQKFLNFLKQ